MTGRFADIAARHGIPPLECDVLCAIDFGGPRHPRFIVSEIETLEPAGPPQVRAALKTCVEAGWARILDHGDCVRDRKRWAAEPQDACSHNPYKKGHVDLTASGAALLERILDEFHGPQRHRNSWILCLPETLGDRLSLFGWNEAVVARTRDEILAEERALGSEWQATGPYVIGPWWRNRFVQVPAGFRVDFARLAPP